MGLRSVNSRYCIEQCLPRGRSCPKPCSPKRSIHLSASVIEGASACRHATTLRDRWRRRSRHTTRGRRREERWPSDRSQGTDRRAHLRLRLPERVLRARLARALHRHGRRRQRFRRRRSDSRKPASRACPTSSTLTSWSGRSSATTSPSASTSWPAPSDRVLLDYELAEDGPAGLRPRRRHSSERRPRSAAAPGAARAAGAPTTNRSTAQRPGALHSLEVERRVVGIAVRDHRHPRLRREARACAGAPPPPPRAPRRSGRHGRGPRPGSGPRSAAGASAAPC